MSLRKFIVLLAVPVLLIGAGIGAWSWLLHTEQGARWIFSKLGSSPAFELRASTITGDMGSGLKLEGVYFANGATRVEVSTISLAVDVDLLPPLVKLAPVHADSVSIQEQERPARDSEEPIDLRRVLSGISLPVPVRFEDVDLARVDYLDVSGEKTLQLQAVTASGQVSDTLVLDGVSLTTEDHDINLAGRFGFTPPHSLEARFKITGAFTVGGELTGTLERLQLEVNSQAPDARLTGSLTGLLDTPGWDIELQAPDLQWPLSGTEPDARLAELVARSQGQWPAYGLDLSTRLMLPGWEPARLELTGNGGKNSFFARHVSLDGSQLALDSRAEISWEAGLAVSANTILKRLDPGTWIEDWPEDHDAAGELALEWSSDRISVPSFLLSVSDTPFVVTGSGQFDLPSGIVEGELNWRALSWPLAAPVPQLSSHEGQFEVSGTPDDWRIDGWLDFQVPELSQGRLRMSGTGNRESLEVQVHEGAILGGILAGSAAFNWTGERPFQFSLLARDIQTAALLPEFPGQISAEFSAGGQLEPLAAEIDIRQLNGMIRHIPLSAGGGLQYAGGRISAHSLEVRSGQSSLSLDGNPYSAEGIRYTVYIKALADFHDDWGGSLSASGSASLKADAPSLSGVLTARRLRFGSSRIDAIDTRQNELVLSGLSLAEKDLESVTLGFYPGKPLEKLDILAAVENRTIRIGLQGSVVDWSAPIETGWKGQLAKLELERDQFSITLDQPAPLEMNLDHFSLQGACLTGTRGAKLCAAASWQDPDEITLAADLSSIPVSLLELFLQTDVRFNQVLSGRMDWRQAPGGIRSGIARIEISPGVITMEGDEDIRLETGAGLFGFEVAGSRLQKGVLDLSIPGSGMIDVNFGIDDLGRGAKSPIQGTARIDLDHVGLVSMLVPALDTIAGVLDVDMALGGTVSDPTFKGRASLKDGVISDRASGFALSGINLTGEITERDRSRLHGTFNAGDGSGKISMTIGFTNILDPVIDLELTGNNLTVIDVPDLNVIADPDLHLSWRDKTLTIDGRVNIPAARLAPSYLPQASVRQSPDVVIVAGESPAVRQDFLQENAVKLRGSLDVELGDEVLVDLDVAKIDVTGSARFDWRDQLIPVANGSFNGTGEIQAYGQFLRITQGRVSFPDIPADNPHLNIRAEREIFGNSQIRRAGLLVAGTLKRPVIEAYTVPMTNRERARTLLVTGSDFNYEQGVGAVDVGMYVLPRLYISYGIGVFEDGNVLKIRYELGRGFGVTATSGQRETGLDISYIIER